MTAQVNKNVSSLIGIELKVEGLEKLKEYSEALATGVRLIEESLEQLNNHEVHLSFGKVTDLKQKEEDEKAQEILAGVIELNPQLIAPQQIFTKRVKDVCYSENVKESIEEVTEIEVLLARKIKKILKKYDLKGEDVKLAFHMAFEMYKRDKDIDFVQSECRDYQRTNSKIQNDPVKICRLREVFLASQEIADIFIETNLSYSYTEYVVHNIQRQQYVMK
ncbi:hypothetical protein GMB34_07215 [Turicibacter sanguinis]|nr:hypothetical protein [Turicibacter sanguinis]MTN83325.1 hypothetical protein [Turicibacter sanguinis]MTN86724.1 hypothetical protein [Turicibacter sanguinis]MTN88890.1 hypothetical protein [Turicibacter sanguinis]MTN91520.1 hypothetical protein [Turicibacter sanguinis]